MRYPETETASSRPTMFGPPRSAGLGGNYEANPLI